MEKVYKINGLLFYPAAMKLVSKQNAVQLKPKVAQVLTLFCQQPQTLISREQLLEQVWAGQIVTDNSINQVITQARKVLHAQEPGSDFIVTVPRQGYQLVAKVTEVLADSKTTFVQKTFKALLLLLPLLLAILYLTGLFSEDESLEKVGQVAKVTALTHSKQAANHPELSFDKQFLAFSLKQDRDKARLYVKQLESEKLYELSPDEGWSGDSAWAHNSLKLAYFYYYQQECKLILLDLSVGLDQIVRTDIASCFADSFGQLVFEHDDNAIIYSARDSKSSPYLLYRLDLSDGQVAKLEQPEPHNAGHLYFDLHPSQNVLLLSSPDKQQKMAYYQLFPDNSDYRYLFSEPYYNCCAIWSHGGDKIISMGVYPATEFIQMDLDGRNRRSLYSSTAFVGPLKRGVEVDTYLYQQRDLDSDIYFYDFARKTSSTDISSSQQELLPGTSNPGGNLVYLTNQAGVSQIWRRQKGLQAEKVATFATGEKVMDIRLSQNGSYAGVLTQNTIYLMDMHTGTKQPLELPQQAISALSWKNEHTLSFSLLNRQGKWQVFYYDLLTEQLEHSGLPWAYIDYQQQTELQVDQSNQLYVNGVKLSLPDFINTRYSRRFNFAFHQHKLYMQPYAPVSWDIYAYHLNEKALKKIATAKGPAQMTVSKDGLYYSSSKSATANIYQLKL